MELTKKLMKRLRTSKAQHGFALSILLVLITITGCYTVHTIWSYETPEYMVPFMECTLRLYTIQDGIHEAPAATSNEWYTHFVVKVVVDSTQEIDPSSDSVSVENMELSQTGIEGPYEALRRQECEQVWGPYLPPPCRSFWRFTVQKPRPDTLYLKFDVVLIDKVTKDILNKETFQRTAILEKEKLNTWEAFGAFD